MYWQFGIINGRLAEVYFERKKDKTETIGHCYVKKKDYKTKQELKWINEDIKHLKLKYKNKRYQKIKP